MFRVEKGGEGQMPRRNQNARPRKEGSQTVKLSVWAIVDTPTPTSLSYDSFGWKRIAPRLPQIGEGKSRKTKKMRDRKNWA
jgi:hypothetical protein